MNDNFSLTFAGKRYRLNINRINEYCFTSNRRQDADREITEAYETDENGEFRMISRINREITDAGGNQDDMIMYDFIKVITVKLLDSGVKTGANETDVDFGFALAFNTLLSEGMIEEIN